MSFEEFISMSGYGKYVWSAYGFTLAVLAINLVSAIRRLRRSTSRIKNPDEFEE